MKKILLSLFVGFIGIISFCSSLNISDFIEYIDTDTVSVPFGEGVIIHNLTNSSDYGTYCVKITSINGYQGFFGMTNDVTNFNNDWFVTFYDDWDFPLYVCTYSNLPYLMFYGRTRAFTVTYELFKLNTLLNTSVPVMTSLECQSEYSLIPISSVNQSYCMNNNLCPGTTFYLNNNYSLNYPAGYDYFINYSDNVSFDYEDSNNEVNFNFDSSGSSFSGNWSSLYINDVQHEGSSIIDITIPEEIAWDYSRSNDVFSVVVSGYNTDPAYIQSVIDVQNYQPTSDDFSKLVGLFGSYGGLLIACLFVIIVFYLVKKMFK